MTMETLRQHCETRLKDMNKVFVSWELRYRELGDYVSPGSYQFNVSEHGRGDKGRSRIINETATFCLDTLERGLFDGATNPAMPWLKVKTPFEEMNTKQGVREWLDAYAERTLEVFRRSNFYAEIPSLFADLGLYGTSACLVEKDPDTIIRLEPLIMGSYRLGMDGKRRVNALGRTFMKSRRELVDQFGDQCIQVTRNAVATGNGADEDVEVCHLIEPNPDYRKGSPFNKHMKFRSVYWEKAAGEGEFLRVGGYTVFPVVAPRWRVRGGNVYGESQTTTVIGTVKELQLLEKEYLTILKKIGSPPLTAPTTMKTKLISQLSGSTTFHDATAGTAKIEPMFQIQSAPLQAIEEKIARCEDRIRKGMFTDLFLMLANLPNTTERTAEEMRLRLKEKVQTLGPILVRLFDEVLDKIVEIVTEIMADPEFAGLVPPAPPELQGMPLNVEYVSELATAMKLARVGLIESTVGFVMNLGLQQAQMQQQPTALDKLNLDKAIDKFGEYSGIPAAILNDEETAGQIRQGRAQQQAQQAEAQQMAQQAATVKDLANAPADTDSVLSRMGGAA